MKVGTNIQTSWVSESVSPCCRRGYRHDTLPESHTSLQTPSGFIVVLSTQRRTFGQKVADTHPGGFQHSELSFPFIRFFFLIVVFFSMNNDQPSMSDVNNVESLKKRQ